MNLLELIKQLPNITRTVNQLRDLAQQNPNLIRELQKWGLDPTQPPQNPDAIYAWSLVKYYDEFHPQQPIINLFGETEIKKDFVENFNSNNLTRSLKQAKDFIIRQGLGNEFREAKINLRAEIQNFYNLYTKVAKWGRPPLDVLRDPKFPELPEYSPYPEDFKALIATKIQSFYGRKFVFREIQQFISNHPNGYFTVVGDAGMGKSAIAAKYVWHYKCPCFFHVRAESRNTPELFLKSIRQQLINRYWLPNAKDDDLPTLLQKVSDNLLPEERLVIVVDALDEVEQKGSDNLLFLPMTLPNRVYFLLTRRPYRSEDERLLVSVPQEKLDLRNQYVEQNLEDVKGYIWSFCKDAKHQDALRKWIEARQISAKEFVEQVAVKSENNFMYLRFVLPAIAEGFYDNLSLDKLPTGLAGYYENHWQVMGMTKKPLPKDKIKIIYVMSALRSAASRSVIAKYAEQDEWKVQEVLDGWAQFLQQQDNYQPPRYRFYHESFRDFLHRKDIVQAAGVSLPDISAEVAKMMTGGIFGNG